MSKINNMSKDIDAVERLMKDEDDEVILSRVARLFTIIIIVAICAVLTWGCVTLFKYLRNKNVQASGFEVYNSIRMLAGSTAKTSSEITQAIKTLKHIAQQENSPYTPVAVFILSNIDAVYYKRYAKAIIMLQQLEREPFRQLSGDMSLLNVAHLKLVSDTISLDGSAVVHLSDMLSKRNFLFPISSELIKIGILDKINKKQDAIDELDVIAIKGDILGEEFGTLCKVMRAYINTHPRIINNTSALK